MAHLLYFCFMSKIQQTDLLIAVDEVVRVRNCIPSTKGSEGQLGAHGFCYGAMCIIKQVRTFFFPFHCIFSKRVASCTPFSLTAIQF